MVAYALDKSFRVALLETPLKTVWHLVVHAVREVVAKIQKH
jgi:hypothetical protein